MATSKLHSINKCLRSGTLSIEAFLNNIHTFNKDKGNLVSISFFRRINTGLEMREGGKALIFTNKSSFD